MVCIVLRGKKIKICVLLSGIKRLEASFFMQNDSTHRSSISNKGMIR